MLFDGCNVVQPIEHPLPRRLRKRAHIALRRASLQFELVRILLRVDGNGLFFFFPRAANFLCPRFVTAQRIEIIGDRGVTTADPLRILWYPLFEAARTEDHLRKSSRSFAVAHLVPRFT